MNVFTIMQVNKMQELMSKRINDYINDEIKNMKCTIKGIFNFVNDNGAIIINDKVAVKSDMNDKCENILIVNYGITNFIIKIEVLEKMTIVYNGNFGLRNIYIEDEFVDNNIVILDGFVDAINFAEKECKKSVYYSKV
jgi:hypothetical protein